MIVEGALLFLRPYKLIYNGKLDFVPRNLGFNQREIGEKGNLN